MSIVAMKRKSQRFIHPISAKAGGFTLNGNNKSVMTTSGVIARRMKGQKNIVSNTEQDKYNSEQGMYTRNVALRTSQCVKEPNSFNVITSEEYTTNINCQ